ncbi:hypothetical protein [Amaricoccus sp.]|uniref:hypothetical protein n=1 Tax=Amaricoccus sp. TaxID=1872485 RepID=UPI001B7A0705|nr:hypothetical protein [Amaricoccus sp.]MBP7002291.1 hypothetical protein [Amaricoccus sp.]
MRTDRLARADAGVVVGVLPVDRADAVTDGPNLDGLSAAEIRAMTPKPGWGLLDAFDSAYLRELAGAAWRQARFARREHAITARVFANRAEALAAEKERRR